MKILGTDVYVEKRPNMWMSVMRNGIHRNRYIPVTGGAVKHSFYLWIPMISISVFWEESCD